MSLTFSGACFAIGVGGRWIGGVIGGKERLDNGTRGSSYIFDTKKRERCDDENRLIDCVDDVAMAIEGNELDVGSELDVTGRALNELLYGISAGIETVLPLLLVASDDVDDPLEGGV